MSTTNALELVYTRNYFYQRLYYLALVIFTLCCVAIMVLLMSLYLIMQRPTEPIYFATDNLGKLINVVPTNQLNMSMDEINDWVTEAIQAAFSYDYVNFAAQLQNAQKYFTGYGWTNYMKTLKANNNLLALKERQLIVIAQVVGGKPRVMRQGLLNNAYSFQLEVPVLMTFWKPPYDATSKILNAWVLEVTVQRQPILQSYKGLGIIQIIAKSS